MPLSTGDGLCKGKVRGRLDLLWVDLAAHRTRESHGEGIVLLPVLPPHVQAVPAVAVTARQAYRIVVAAMARWANKDAVQNILRQPAVPTSSGALVGHCQKQGELARGTTLIGQEAYTGLFLTPPQIALNLSEVDKTKYRLAGLG